MEDDRKSKLPELEDRIRINIFRFIALIIIALCFLEPGLIYKVFGGFHRKLREHQHKELVKDLADILPAEDKHTREMKEDISQILPESPVFIPLDGSGDADKK